MHFKIRTVFFFDKTHIKGHVRRRHTMFRGRHQKSLSVVSSPFRSVDVHCLNLHPSPPPARGGPVLQPAINWVIYILMCWFEDLKFRHVESCAVCQRPLEEGSLSHQPTHHITPRLTVCDYTTAIDFRFGCWRRQPSLPGEWVSKFISESQN